MTGRAATWIRRATIGCVGMLALVAGTVSYMHLLVELHGQAGWVAALVPSRCGRSSSSTLELFSNRMGGWPPGTCSRLAGVTADATASRAGTSLKKPEATIRALPSGAGQQGRARCLSIRFGEGSG